MRILHISLLTAGLAFGLSVPASAAQKFNIDPAHTNIMFLVSHFGYSKIIGQFNEFEGSFEFDKDKVADSKVDIVVKTASVDTDHQKRDDHLRSADFFNSEEFPEMTFKSTGIEKTGDNTGKLTGDLTILGQTHPVTLDVTFNKMAPHPIPFYKGVMVAGFSARGKVDRTAYGMSYGAGALGNEIELMLEVEGQEAK